jgi:hypothetical protein
MPRKVHHGGIITISNAAKHLNMHQVNFPCHIYISQMHMHITRTKSIVEEEVVRKYCYATTNLYYEHTGKGYRTEQAFRRVKHEAQISGLLYEVRKVLL